jgi:pilus assembly protein Flp/PilA
MLAKLIQHEDGSQVVEYALIVALISIVLVLAMQPLVISAGIGSFVTRLAACLTTGTCP